jgi:hypothetical protein
MSAMIEVILIRAALVDKRQYAAGALIRVTPAMAGELISWGQAKLADLADLGLVVDHPARHRRIGRFVAQR